MILVLAHLTRSFLKGVVMARSSIPVLSEKKYAAQSNKSKRAHRTVQLEDDSPRKTSMSAYCRPQHRGFINLDQWDMDDSENDEKLHA
jgi:hypothetical protein